MCIYKNTPRTYRWLLQANGEVEGSKKKTLQYLYLIIFLSIKLILFSILTYNSNITEEVH